MAESYMKVFEHELEDGRTIPRVFYISKAKRLLALAKNINSMILKNGGTVTNHDGDGYIQVKFPGEKISPNRSGPFCTPQFIVNCVSEKEFLDLTSSVARTPPKKRRRGSAYQPEDDKEIISYAERVASNFSPTTVKFWEGAQKDILRGERTAHALHTRYKTLRKLGKLNLDNETAYNSKADSSESEQEDKHEESSQEYSNLPVQQEQSTNAGRTQDAEGLLPAFPFRDRSGLVQKVLDDLCEKTGYGPAVVVHALVVYSGNMALAKAYLDAKGVCGSDVTQKPWTVQEDAVLMSKNILGTLEVIKKRGRTVTFERINFLENVGFGSFAI